MNPDCDECGGSGICGSPPDMYFDCPACTDEPVDIQDTRDDRCPLYGDEPWKENG